MDDPKYYRPIIAILIETLIISALTTKGCEYSLWITSSFFTDISDEEVSFHFKNNNTKDYKFSASGIFLWSEDFEIIELGAYLNLSKIETDNNGF